MMNKQIKLSFHLVAAVLTALLLAAAPSWAGNCSSLDTADDNAGNCFLLRAPAGLIPQIAANHGLTVERQVRPSDPHLVVVEGPVNLLPETALANMRADPDVLEIDQITLEKLAENDDDATLEGLKANKKPSQLAEAGMYVGSENDFFNWAQWDGYLSQMGRDKIQIPLMRDSTDVMTFGAGIVAVIDTGVDPDHKTFELAGGGGDSALMPGYDFLRDQGGIPSEWHALDPATSSQTKQDLTAVGDQSYAAVIEGSGVEVVLDASTELIIDQSYAAVIEGLNLPPAFGHGTMVAGIVRAVAPNAKIMPLRVFDGNGNATIDDIVAAIYFAIDNGAHVINMSFSTSTAHSALSRALKEARRAGVVLVTSAGNEGTAAQTYPAAYGEVMGIGSTDLDDNYSLFSNTGPHVFMSAPGEEVVTIFPGNNYAAAWGTSFSSAWVAGSTALLHGTTQSGSLDPVTPRNAEGDFEGSADAVVNQTTEMGAGRLDAEGAHSLENGNPDQDV